VSWLLLLASARAADAEPEPAAAEAEGAPVQAAEPSPARQCADAAVGSQVEVCLRIAVENPDAVYDVAAALIAHLDRAEAPDRALLEALLLVSTGAAEGASRLGALRDPRAVPVLLHHARTHPDSEVAEAAIAALSAYPTAIPALSDWLVDRSIPPRQREAIARTLGAAAVPEAADALQDALRRRLPPLVRAAVVDTLTTAYPDRLPGELPPSTDGARWLATAASLGLGFSMGTAGVFSDNELWPMWALTGAVGGASVGWVAGRAWPMEAGDAATIATLGVGGAASGSLIGAGISRGQRGATAAPLLYGFAGQFVGLGVGYGLERIDGREVTEIDAIEAAAFAGLLGGAAEFGGVFVSDNGMASPRALLTGTSLAAGLAMGQLLSPRVDAQEQAAWVATGAGLGVAAGLLAPIGDQRRSTLPLATLCGGAALGLTFGATEPPQDVFFGGTVGALIGGGLGIGGGLLVEDQEPDVARGLGIVGMLGGYGVGAVVSRIDPDPVDDRDVVVGIAAGGWAAWDAIAAAALLDLGPRRTTGLVVLSSAVATGTASALNLSLDVPVPHTLSASSIGLWGGYAGAAIGDLAGIEPFALALPLSNAGWVLGAVLMSPYVGTPPLVVGIADAGGVLGASLAATASGLATRDRDERGRRTVVAWSLGGATVGLVAGAAVGEWWRTSNQWKRRDVARASRGGVGPALRAPRLPPITLAPLAVSGGAGVSLEVSGW
jgi:hypothetical protein